VQRKKFSTSQPKVPHQNVRAAMLTVRGRSPDIFQVLQLSVECTNVKAMKFNLVLCTCNVIRFETYIPDGFFIILIC
jgi:hypothetical protein